MLRLIAMDVNADYLELIQVLQRLLAVFYVINVLSVYFSFIYQTICILASEVSEFYEEHREDVLLNVFQKNF